MEDINTILELKTVQIAPFRSIFTSLKEILVVTNICFTKDEMSIINMDKSRTIVVDCKLFAKEFEYYKCLEEKFVIGVKMSYLFRLISSLESDDTLTIFIDEKDYRDGVVEHLGLKFENGIKNQCKIHKLKLVDPDQEEYQFPDGLTYSSELSMPSNNFQKIIRDFIPLGDIIHLESVDNELRFTVLGKISDSKYVL
jgi:proliferating cell nuclear antigen PCNA